MSLDLKLTAKEINEILWRTHKTISTAESCTSGRIASVLTAIPGASAYFYGGMVAYKDEIKITKLNVDAQIIEEKTAVCEEVVKQMVIGANQFFDTDYSVAVSGFAGPGGPDPKTSLRVGTIWIAAGNKENMLTTCLTEDDGRERNIQRATTTALRLLLEIIRKDLEDESNEASNEASSETNTK